MYFLKMNLEDFMLPCLNKSLFGFECMGCGMQRAFILLFKGEFINAFYMYPAIYGLLPLFIVAIVTHYKNFKYSNIVIIGLAVITVSLIIGNYLIKHF